MVRWTHQQSDRAVGTGSVSVKPIALRLGIARAYCGVLFMIASSVMLGLSALPLPLPMEGLIPPGIPILPDLSEFLPGSLPGLLGQRHPSYCVFR